MCDDMKSLIILQLLFSFHDPIGDGTDLVVEVGADLDYGATVGTERKEVVAVVDLSNGCLGAAVDLELEEVEVVRRPDHKVDAA